ncbi:MAG TPA: hypothetical protein VHX61_18810 [Rhizomicrobium sp.]|nr:hypothetical protein [Rhizomicrobium sp.]
MTPETGEHLDKARAYLTKSRALLDVMHYNDEAGRAAYLAGYHAAQALISERTGRIAQNPCWRKQPVQLADERRFTR